MTTETLTATDDKKRAVAALVFCLSPVGKKAVRDLRSAEAAAAKVAAKRTYVSDIVVSMNLTGIDGAQVTNSQDLWTVSDSQKLTDCLNQIRQADIAHGFKCAKDGKCPQRLADMEVSRLEQVIAVGMFGEELYGNHLVAAVRLAKSAP